MVYVNDMSTLPRSYVLSGPQNERYSPRAYGTAITKFPPSALVLGSGPVKDRNRFYNYKSIPNRYKPIMKPILTILTGLHLIFSKFETKGRFRNIRHRQHTYKWHIRDIGIITRSHQLQTFTKPIKINRFALTGYMLRISKFCQWELDLFSCEIGYCTCQK